jgi:8-oxo-dGTP diphosphatase
MDEPRPKVGVGVMVIKNGKVLMTRRKGSHGAGEYAYPGGHMEFGESFEQCARREVAEETGLKIKNIKFLRLANVTKYEGKHYIDIALMAEWGSGEPQLLEPEKAEGWDWYNLDNLPPNLFEFCKTAFEALKTGQQYFDVE